MYELAIAVRCLASPPFDFYGADWCGDCRRAKAALDRFGVAYNLHDIEHCDQRTTAHSRDSVRRRWLMAGGAFGHTAASQMQGARPALIQHFVCHLTSRTRRIISCSARRRMWVGFRTVDVRLLDGLCPARGHCLHTIAFFGKFLLGFGNGCRTYERSCNKTFKEKPKKGVMPCRSLLRSLPLR